MLFMSGLLNSYSRLCLKHKYRFERPPIFNRYESYFVLVHIGLFLSGVVIVFITVGWKWVIATVITYWSVTDLVLEPFISKKFFSFSSNNPYAEANMKTVSKILTESLTERKVIEWDGLEFVITRTLKPFEDVPDVITLNPIEMRELVGFLSICLKDESIRKIITRQNSL